MSGLISGWKTTQDIVNALPTSSPTRLRSELGMLMYTHWCECHYLNKKNCNSSQSWDSKDQIGEVITLIFQSKATGSHCVCHSWKLCTSTLKEQETSDVARAKWQPCWVSGETWLGKHWREVVKWWKMLETQSQLKTTVCVKEQKDDAHCQSRRRSG